MDTNERERVWAPDGNRTHDPPDQAITALTLGAMLNFKRAKLDSSGLSGIGGGKCGPRLLPGPDSTPNPR
jgi:hypothetical protein